MHLTLDTLTKNINRYHRKTLQKRCDDVYFLSGTDEHGIKIQKTSASQGITPKELCDTNAQKFQDCWKALGIDYNQFIRTTDEQHEKIVQKIFKKLVEKGDIYKHSYKGLYCSGCECFLSEKDLTEDGLCPDHMKNLKKFQKKIISLNFQNTKMQSSNILKKIQILLFQVSEQMKF